MAHRILTLPTAPSAPGVTDFLGLTNTPVAFVTANAIYKVNAAGDAVEEAPLVVTASALHPLVDNALSLGIQNTKEWSDAHFADGAIIGFNNREVDFVHSTNLLTLNGGNLAMRRTFDGGMFYSIRNDINGSLSTTALSFRHISATFGDVTLAGPSFLATSIATKNSLRIRIRTLDGVVPANINSIIDSGSDTGKFAWYKDDLNGELMQLNVATNTLHLGETANANMGIGITINQKAEDGQAFALKSSDVVTVLTTITTQNVETDDYFTLSKVSATLGGTLVQSLAEDAALTNALRLASYGGTADTTKTTAGRGLVEIYVSEHDGANALADITADGNIFAIIARVGAADVARLILDKDGDLLLFGNLQGSAGIVEARGAPGSSVGGFASGNFHVTSSSASVNSNAVITGHNLFTGNKQLWYLGSVSSSNDNIAFINRQTGSLAFLTDNATRMTVLATSNTLQGNGGLTIEGGSGVHTLTLSGGVTAASSIAIGNASEKIGMYGVTEVVRGAVLTAEDATVIDATYGTVEEAVLNNVRTRLGELEARMQALGAIN